MGIKITFNTIFFYEVPAGIDLLEKHIKQI